MRRRYVQKSPETLAGYPFFDFAVKAKQDEEDNVTSEELRNVGRLGVSCACPFREARKHYKYKPFLAKWSKHVLFCNVLVFG